MSIIKAIARAYKTMEERNWDTIYWAIDLHGVCLRSNYEQGGYEWINYLAVEALKVISQRPETKIILWSSVYDDEKLPILDFFNKEAIPVWGFNTNPWENDTKVSCFEEKFYFSVLLDDKAGFDPARDWQQIINYFNLKDQSKMSMSKPEDGLKAVVHYAPRDSDYIHLSERAWVYAIDHPRLGEGQVDTSRVVRIEPNTGVFETLNTVYKPLSQLNG